MSDTTTPVRRAKWSLPLHIDILRGVQRYANAFEPSSYFVGNIHASEVVAAIDNTLDALEQAEAENARLRALLEPQERLHSVMKEARNQMKSARRTVAESEVNNERD
ncbi:MAG: hypothetical protein ACK5JO_07065 [Halodesulfovibrio sp.]